MTADGFGIELLEAFYHISSRPEGLGKNAGSPVQGGATPLGKIRCALFKSRSGFAREGKEATDDREKRGWIDRAGKAPGRAVVSGSLEFAVPDRVNCFVPHPERCVIIA